MKFETVFVSREDPYSLGVEVESGLHYAALPVSNQLVDYMEYYKLTEDEYDRLLGDPIQAVEFVESCRNRKQDQRLFMKPGSDRGIPR